MRTETTNPWYWGIRTLAKVRPRPPGHPAAAVAACVRLAAWQASPAQAAPCVPAVAHGSQALAGQVWVA